ncbi:hypothetical protein NWP21_11010 [Anabaenopsis sp. FSS-46]|uniref:hypothetical protein n=1 Tax=Anabaenopsis sp. FSS-46 TaxID=2971766 RepID=UPI00247500FD|nr:hypothetical protein [Anabaenopsis sp. FSS-46]MDH6099358.1 hypothetical protein [Anabaenopsis sp. FSS-46]
MSQASGAHRINLSSIILDVGVAILSVISVDSNFLDWGFWFTSAAYRQNKSHISRMPRLHLISNPLATFSTIV